MDLLAPPQWIGPPGQLIPWSATSAASTGWYSVHGTDSQVLQVTLPPSGGMSPSLVFEVGVVDLKFHILYF